MTAGSSHLLFSYGTLRQEEVQRAIFGRPLKGESDAITGYSLSTVIIDDPLVVEQSGSAIHPIMIPSKDAASEIDGMVFALSQSDLAAADLYETSAYRRIEVSLRSGRFAWVYVKA